MNDNDITIIVRAPKEYIRDAVKRAIWKLDKCPEVRGETVNRPRKGFLTNNPFLVTVDGNEINVEYIHPDEIDALNHSLDLCGFRPVEK